MLLYKVGQQNIAGLTLENHQMDNRTLVVPLHCQTGNVLFEIASGAAIAEHYKLNMCLDSSTKNYHLVKEVAPVLDNVPEACSINIHIQMAMGNKIELFNHCCVFEDFTVRSQMSLNDLFGKPWNQQEEPIYYLRSYLQSWKYLKMGPKESELRLKQWVKSDAREKLENMFPGHKRVAVHLRVKGASDPRHFFNFPG